jgi:hypothetical protein
MIKMADASKLHNQSQKTPNMLKSIFVKIELTNTTQQTGKSHVARFMFLE